MPDSLEKLIRKKILDFVSGKISLRSFNRWFIPSTWDIEEHSAPLQEVVYGLKALLDHYDNGHLTKRELLEKSFLLLNSSLGLELNEFSVQTKAVAKESQTAGPTYILNMATGPRLPNSMATSSGREQSQATAVRFFRPQFQAACW